GRLQRVEDLLGDLPGVLDLADDVDEHRELVAAETRDGVLFTDGAADAGGHDLQQAVTDGVTERVVDLLEPVDVEEQDRQLVAMAVCVAERNAEAVVEQG